ncbi:MAG: hypothetical protein IJP92_06690 [Lachnospiraceae bacterium]|nr:hypothetical protein [Lachnospiraceae bacterium]
MKRLFCVFFLMCCIIVGCVQKGDDTPADKDAPITAEDTAPDDKKVGHEQTTESVSSEPWADVKKITIYHGGSLDELDMSSPLVVEDTEIINNIVNSIADSDEIQPVPSDEQFEGLNSVFVEFGNGVIVSMYDDINYGCIGTEMKEDGDVRLPQEFHELIMSLINE